MALRGTPEPDPSRVTVFHGGESDGRPGCQLHLPCALGPLEFVPAEQSVDVCFSVSAAADIALVIPDLASAADMENSRRPTAVYHNVRHRVEVTFRQTNFLCQAGTGGLYLLVEAGIARLLPAALLPAIAEHDRLHPSCRRCGRAPRLWKVEP